MSRKKKLAKVLSHLAQHDMLFYFNKNKLKYISKFL